MLIVVNYRPKNEVCIAISFYLTLIAIRQFFMHKSKTRPV